MSADAKMWCEDEGWEWSGIADATPGIAYEGTLYEVIESIEHEANDGRPMRWVLTKYEPGGKLGLRGFYA